MMGCFTIGAALTFASVMIGERSLPPKLFSNISRMPRWTLILLSIFVGRIQVLIAWFIFLLMRLNVLVRSSIAFIE